MKRSTFSILFFIKRNSPKNNGKATINIRITIDGEQSHFSSKLDISPQLWDQKSNKAKGRRKESIKINEYLELIQCTLYSHYVELTHQYGLITPIMIKKAFMGLSPQTSLIYVFQDHIKYCRSRKGKNISDHTILKYEITLERLMDFMKVEYLKEDIQLHRIDLRFIEKFHIFLMNNYGCCHNTAMKYVQRFATVMRYAERSGILKNNPFIQYHVGFDKIDTVFLSQDEVNRIQKKRFATKRLKEIRDIFIFCCYTGLSFSDITALKPSDIITGFDGKPWIMISRTKTSQPAHIPLLEVPLKLIRCYAKCQEWETIFPVKSNQKTNEYLKEIAILCGIHKPITFHVARHTFATLMLNYGVSIESLSRMLGHSTIKTTQYYARITDRKISSDMDSVEKTLSKT